MVTMAKEIDVRLFVTCRLCIEEVGQYQIVPTVQEQFKYCFDINVDPFDGLPQLICQKCCDILSKFYELKKRFSEKQTDLMNKYKSGIRVECMPQHDIVSSSQRTDVAETKKKSPNKIKRSYFSSESNESSKSKKKKTKTLNKKTKKWDHTGFKKEFVCIICKSVLPSKESVKKHQTLHNMFLAQHHIVFKKNLSVLMKRVDDKPNITGQSNIVVHNKNTIIENCNSLFFIKYSKENIKEASDGNCSKNEVNKISSMNDIIAETSDIEEEMIRIPKHRKRLRVLSRSSTDTVVLESNRNSDNEDSKSITQKFNDVQTSQTVNDQCINIADSSDSDADTRQIDSTYSVKQSVETNDDDHKIIENIISACVKAYSRKPELLERSDKYVNTESHLKQKVLSLGRKIINRPFNSTGLLRYMEHKNLSITWATRAISNNTGKDSDYIRIMTKLRSTDTTDDYHGWTPIVPSDEGSVTEFDQNSATNQVTKLISENVHSVQAGADSAILVAYNQTDHKSKLLNANPVANPKQLPRKTANNEVRFNSVELSVPFQNNEDPNLCMPIITSTTSLAAPNILEQHQDESNPIIALTTGKQTDPPRIKVKPYSQLMSENALNSLRQELSTGALPMNMLQHPANTLTNMLQSNSDNTNNLLLQPIQNNTNMQWPSQNPPNALLSAVQPVHLSTMIPQISNYNPSTAVPNATIMNSKNKEEYILNSVDMPNTKTNSPFEYLKDLFQMHDITLVEHQDNMSLLYRHFICLIKFKVKFEQEPIAEPVTLCLSLYCYKNSFCFIVKDRNELSLDIHEIPANWQWEIVNLFRGNLVDKLLQNAQKHSQETHDFTKKFICLLKSVSFKKNTTV